MFDWNDEELSNIIRDGDGESIDHTVPYPEASEDLCKKKEWKKDESKIKLTEQKIPHSKIEFHGRKLGSISNVDDGVLSVSGFGMDLWPELLPSKAAKTDEGTTESPVLNTESDSIGGEHMHVLEEIAQNNQDKEHGDFVDNGWDNIGSFDDLDWIFSYDDPIFGNVSLDNADEIGSSKDASNSTASIYLNSPRSSGSLRSGHEHDHEHLDVKDNNLQNVHNLADHLDYVAATVKHVGKKPQITPAGRNFMLTDEDVPTPNEPLVKANNILKTRRKSKRRFKGKMPQSGQCVNQSEPSGVQTTASPSLRQQQQFQDSLQFQNISNPNVNPSAYGNLAHTYPAMSVLSSIQPVEVRHRCLPSGNEVHSSKGNLVKMPVNSYVKPFTMTPKEKIEKLRRRQKIQAMIAIQKQKQQLSHQVPCTNESFTHKQIYFSDGTDFVARDTSTTIPALHPNSQIKPDDSSTISAAAAHDYMAEGTVLYKLQEIISKLDIKIRLCIRDSLFRLALSANERHCASDTNNTKDELSGYSSCRNAGLSANETETNPVDRTVARILFHMPMDLSGNNPETHDSPISVKAAGFMNSPFGRSQEDLKCNCKQPLSKPRPENACTLTESQHGDQFKSNPCVENSECVNKRAG